MSQGGRSMTIEETLNYQNQINHLKQLLEEINNLAVNLRTSALTKDEQNGIKEVINCFDSRVREMVFGTLKNLEGYKQFRWQELFYKGEKTDGGTDSICENRK